MAHFYRVIFFALFCASVLFSRPVFAVNSIYYKSGSVVSDPGSFCPPATDHPFVRWQQSWINEIVCIYRHPQDLYFVNGPYIAFDSWSCPANSSRLGAQGRCTCSSGYTDTGSSCESPRPTAAEAVALVTAMGNVVVAGNSLSLEMCVKGTSVRGQMSAVYPEFGNAIWGPYTSTGQACTVGSGAGVAAPATMPRVADAADSTSCAALGGQYGKVNGVAVCVPRSDDPPNVAGVVQPSPESQTTADGTVIAEVNTTTCDSSTCTTTTTTTTTPPGGTSTTSTATATASQDDYCRQNSHLAMCKDARYFAQGCAAPPACDGDAIQCGIARQTWATSCALDPSETAETSRGRSAAAVVGDQSANLEGNRSIAISASSYSQDPVFSPSGMSDVTVTVSGQQITIPFSSVNYILEMLGSIGVAVCFLAAMKITFGGQIA